jgi:hypothetical protein
MIFLFKAPPSPLRFIVAYGTSTAELVLTMTLRVSRVSAAGCKGTVKVMMRFKDEMIFSAGYGFTARDYSATPIFFIYCIFTIYSRYLKRVISKRDGFEYLKQVPSIDGSLELI